MSQGGRSCDLNYEQKRQYLVTLEVQDNGIPPLTYVKNFTISLRDINDRPRNLQLSNNQVEENAPLNTFIGKLTATDEDKRQVRFTYILKFSVTQKALSKLENMRESDHMTRGTSDNINHFIV